MRRDPTEFRKRFKAWKDGERVYDGGRPMDLPAFADGKNRYNEDDLIEYLGALENPTRHGLKDGIWRTPTDSTKWDVNQIGMGLDIRKEHNPIVYEFLRSKGRLNNPWLTTDEERLLRKKTWLQKKPILDKFIADKDLSERGIMTAAGMLWQGHPYKMMNTADSVTGKAFTQALANGDKDLSTVFDAYYQYPANKKRYLSRINANTKWWDTHPQVLLRAATTAILPVVMSPQEGIYTAPADATAINLNLTDKGYPIADNTTWKALNHFKTMDDLLDFNNAWDWSNMSPPQLLPVFPLNAKEWLLQSLLNYEGGKDAKPKYGDGIVGAIKNAILGAAIAEDSAVATAAGWLLTKDGVIQSQNAATKLLGDALTQLSFFSPTNPLTAITTGLLNSGARMLGIGKPIANKDLVLPNKTKVVPLSEIDGLTTKDFSDWISGKNVDVLKDKIPYYLYPTTKLVPQDVIQAVQTSVTPRLAEMRPYLQLDDVYREVLNAINRNYLEFPIEAYLRAGEGNTIGMLIPSTDFISIRSGSANKALQHELRHSLYDLYPPNPEEEKLIKLAYNHLFPKNIERWTTNGDARRILIGDKANRTLPVEQQNELIDAAKKSNVINAVKKANAYGAEYIKHLMDLYGDVPDNIVNAIRKSMKYIGVGNAAVSVKKKKSNK